MPKIPRPGTAALYLDIPADLKQKALARAAENGHTLTNAVVALLELYLRIDWPRTELPIPSPDQLPTVRPGRKMGRPRKQRPAPDARPPA